MLKVLLFFVYFTVMYGKVVFDLKKKKHNQLLAGKYDDLKNKTKKRNPHKMLLRLNAHQGRHITDSPYQPVITWVQTHYFCLQKQSRAGPTSHNYATARGIMH